jgi:hypothetical protein
MPSRSRVSALLASLAILSRAIIWAPCLQGLVSSIIPIWKPASHHPQVKIPQDLVIGTILDHKLPARIEAFLGISYAQPATR